MKDTIKVTNQLKKKLRTSLKEKLLCARQHIPNKAINIYIYIKEEIYNLEQNLYYLIPIDEFNLMSEFWIVFD